MFDCTTENYDKIYSPWLENPDTLLLLGGYKPQDRLLDLCGGSGVVTQAALDICHKQRQEHPPIDLLDLNPRFIRCGGTGPAEVIQHKEAAQNLLLRMTPQSKDLVVCRQAIAYLDLTNLIPDVASVLVTGGKFVFNSFDRPRRFRSKSYKFRGARYVEAYVFLFNRIIHLQWRIGVGKDISIFRYHPITDRLLQLHNLFDVKMQTEGSSIRWICTKR